MSVAGWNCLWSRDWGVFLFVCHRTVNHSISLVCESISDVLWLRVFPSPHSNSLHLLVVFKWRWCCTAVQCGDEKFIIPSACKTFFSLLHGNEIKKLNCFPSPPSSSLILSTSFLNLLMALRTRPNSHIAWCLKGKMTRFILFTELVVFSILTIFMIAFSSYDGEVSECGRKKIFHFAIFFMLKSWSGTNSPSNAYIFYLSHSFMMIFIQLMMLVL